MNEWDWNAVGTHVNFYKGERVLSVTEAAEELNTLERELAAANANIEKAPHDAKCSSLWRCTQCKNNHPWHKRSNHENEYHAWSPVECDCWKSED